MRRSSWTKRLILSAFVVAACASTRAGAQTRATLKLGDVAGESTQRPGEIDVLAFSLGVSHPAATGATPSAGKLQFQNLRVTKVVDGTTPKLFQSCAAGQMFGTAALTVLAPDGSVLLTYALGNAQIVSLKTEAGQIGDGGAGAGNTSAPVETVELSYTKLEIMYRDGKSGAASNNAVDAPKGQVELQPPPQSLTPADPARSPATAPSTIRRKR